MVECTQPTRARAEPGPSRAAPGPVAAGRQWLPGPQTAWVKPSAAPLLWWYAGNFTVGQTGRQRRMEREGGADLKLSCAVGCPPGSLL